LSIYKKNEYGTEFHGKSYPFTNPRECDQVTNKSKINILLYYIFSRRYGKYTKKVNGELVKGLYIYIKIACLNDNRNQTRIPH
jgi:hypothetical protein